jgi:hypothetical protein
MEQKEYTIKEIVVDAVRTLSELQIPVSLVRTIAEPIYRVTCNLQSCVAAFERQEQEDTTEEKDGAGNGTN